MFLVYFVNDLQYKKKKTKVLPRNITYFFLTSAMK